MRSEEHIVVEKTVLERELAAARQVIDQQAQLIAQHSGQAELTSSTTIPQARDAFAAEQEKLLETIEAGRTAMAALDLISSRANQGHQQYQEIGSKCATQRQTLKLISHEDLDAQLQDPGFDLEVLLQLGSLDFAESRHGQVSRPEVTNSRRNTSAHTAESTSESSVAERNSRINDDGLRSRPVFPSWAQAVVVPGGAVQGWTYRSGNTS